MKSDAHWCAGEVVLLQVGMGRQCSGFLLIGVSCAAKGMSF